MRGQFVAISAGLLSLGGCTTHPLPEDFSKLDTNHIVFYIRCQAGDAINQSVARYLQNQPDGPSREQGRLIAARKISMAEVELSKLNPVARSKIIKYGNAAIAYDFTFDMSEQNNFQGSANFINQFTNGTFGLGITAGKNLQRQTVRNFRATDTFAELTEPNNCAADPRSKNWGYPITGDIGLEEVVQTFVNLNEFQHLSGKSDDDKVPVMADALTFQTTISSSVAPKVTLTPVMNRFQLADAGITGSSSRTDIHKVIIALSLPPSKAVSNTPAAVGLLGLQTNTGANFGKTPAEYNAESELTNQVGREIITTLSNK
jgi:hypothetical protein